MAEQCLDCVAAAMQQHERRILATANAVDLVINLEAVHGRIAARKLLFHFEILVIVLLCVRSSERHSGERSNRERRRLDPGSHCSKSRCIFVVFWNRRVHSIPWLRIRSKNVELRTKPARVIQATGVDPDDS